HARWHLATRRFVVPDSRHTFTGTQPKPATAVQTHFSSVWVTLWLVWVCIVVLVLLRVFYELCTTHIVMGARRVDGTLAFVFHREAEGVFVPRQLTCLADQ
ncbi:unnamed protein product, partial [Ectocarpus sp. 12 AP-2014]